MPQTVGGVGAPEYATGVSSPPYTKTSSIRPSPPGKLNLRSASFSSVPPFSHLDTLLIFFVSFFSFSDFPPSCAGCSGSLIAVFNQHPTPINPLDLIFFFSRAPKPTVNGTPFYGSWWFLVPNSTLSLRKHTVLSRAPLYFATSLL